MKSFLKGFLSYEVAFLLDSVDEEDIEVWEG
jgi:hypothetical protein